MIHAPSHHEADRTGTGVSPSDPAERLHAAGRGGRDLRSDPRHTNSVCACASGGPGSTQPAKILHIGIPGHAEAGDRFGAAIAGPAIGAPGEALGGKSHVGNVTFVVGSAGGVNGYVLSQASAGIQDRNEAGDRFGEALAIIYYPPLGGGFLIVGAPGEDVRSKQNAGAAWIIRTNFADPGSSYFLSQSTPGVPGGSEPGDSFGASATGTSGS